MKRNFSLFDRLTAAFYRRKHGKTGPLCCPSMAVNIAQKGQRGFSVAFGLPEIENSTVPTLVYRICEEGDENLLTIEAPVPVSISGMIGFTYCPWCGKRLV